MTSIPAIVITREAVPAIDLTYVHPVYGPWQPGWKTIPGFEKYQIDEHGRVLSEWTGKLLKLGTNARVQLHDSNGEEHTKRVYHLQLLSFFPHIDREGRGVDHINENRNDHYLNNLQWLYGSENTTKSVILRPRNNGLIRSKEVAQFSNDKVFLRTFVSANEAQRITGISSGSICQCCNKRRRSAGGFIWKYTQLIQDEPGEVWATNDIFKTMLRQRGVSENSIAKTFISNLGRIKTRTCITRGSKANQTGHRFYQGYLVHRLVWVVFGHCPLPTLESGLQILHNDTITRDSEGCVSNAIEHLSIGTQSENMQQYYKYKHTEKRDIWSTSSSTTPMEEDPATEPETPPTFPA